MKKTKSMRVALGMLALTLITSCFVGGTFAKYTTSGTANDKARVAKFGVKVSATGSAFSEVYATDNDDFKAVYTNSVVSSAADNADVDDKVVAPGTKGNMAAFEITGTPEVAVTVSYSATMTLNDQWKDKEGNFYCPIIIKVGDNTIKQGDTITPAEGDSYTIDSAANFKKAVESAINAYTESYEANTDLSTIGNDGAPSVSWEWEFEGEVAGATLAGIQTDVKDTYLGDQAAAGVAATIELSIAATVTQID